MTSGRKPRRRAKALAPHTVEIEIGALGGRGDGVGQAQGQPVYVPCTVPGDRVAARIDGRRGDGWAATLLDVLVAGPGRRAPVCGHFGSCGGCALQHVAPDVYGDWKRGQLVAAMRRAGFAAEQVQPTLSIAPGTRRRAAFAFHRHRKTVVLGFNARASHQVVDLRECPLMAPALLAIVPSLRALLAEIVEDGVSGDAIVTLTDNGLDLLVEAEARLDLFDRERLAAFADSADLARLSWRRPGTGLIEPLAHRRPAEVRFAGVAVDLPPGGFLQPSPDGEAALAGLVTAAVGSRRRAVADLFAGSGSFTFPLAKGAAVHAVEGDAAALAALRRAADAAQARVVAECRDLNLRPLLADDLKRFDAVVFDPPRAGAAAQAEQLAAAGPALVVAVSCNPATLARDARTLAGGGYRLAAVTPVDQFPWSAHLEAVAVFER
jgi:23S rRNA (uracil1939-C5)-methyltransferase